MSTPAEVRQLLSRLKPGQLDQIQDVLTDYQQHLSHEAGQGHALADLESKLHFMLKGSQVSSDNAAIHIATEAGGGGMAPSRPLGNMIANGDPDQLVNLVMSLVSGDNQEDLKGLIQDLEALKKQKGRLRRALALGAGLGLLLGLGVFLGARAVPPPDADHPPDPGVGVPAVQLPPSEAGADPCPLEFVYPASPQNVPVAGPLNVQWSSYAGAVSYALQVIPPNGAGVPWLVPTEETSKNIYMENFPAAGKYQFAVSALDEHGQVLCKVAFEFEKAANDEANRAKESEGGGGQSCDPNGIFGC